MSYPVDYLDERAKRLDAKLRKLLLLYLAGELSAALCKAMGAEIIEDEYVLLIVHLRKKYDSPQGFNSVNERLQAVLKSILDDFNKLVDEEEAETYWQTEAGKIERVWLISLAFLYGLYATGVVEVAIITGSKWLEYCTMEDIKVCEVCNALRGYYSIYEVLPSIPVHGSCRCWWEIVV